MSLSKKHLTHKHYGLQSKALRNRKRRRTIFFSLFAFALPCLFLAGIVYVSNISHIQIDTIEVLGAQTIKSEVLQNIAREITAKPYAYVFSQNTVVTYPQHKIEQAIASSSLRIKSVEVEAKGLRGLSINIVERASQAVWCSENNQCSNIDDVGFLYEATSANSTSSMFVFYGYTEADHVPYIRNALEFIETLKHLDLIPVSMIITPEVDAEILLIDGLVLKVSLPDDPMQRIDVVRTLLSDATFSEKFNGKNLQYIDLRFGNKVYYKSRGAGQESLLNDMLTQ